MTLLVVEDSVTMRRVLEITFAGLDYRVVAVPGGDAALQKVKAEKTDLVIADVTLDGRNGYELCKAIKQAAPDRASQTMMRWPHSSLNPQLIGSATHRLRQ